MIDIAIIKSAMPQLLSGALITIQIALIALVIGLIGGTVVGFAQAKNMPFFRWLIPVYVTLIRGTPMLIQITFFYFVLPKMGITLSSFWTAVLAIGVNSCAYMSQIIRGGIMAVSKDQLEAAQVLGLTPWQRIRYIILPQALRITLPALVGECITLIKDSSLASIIGVSELYKEARSVMSHTYDVVTVFFIVGLFYLAMTSLVSFISHIIQRKMKWDASYIEPQ